MLPKSIRTLLSQACLQVDINCFHDTQRIEALMLEEALVLGGGHRVDQHARDIGELYQASLFAVVVEQTGDQLRLELVLAPLGIVVERNDLRNTAARKLDDAG